ncbi:MAG TPA: TlpA disulfide reductase family protein [Terriglobales bacterium]|nr:TlpA disulfide reductase family protein [Terriglobales bacterium]
MGALSSGVLAPDFKLTTTDGRTVSLKEALRRGPVVAAFFKISCPICQMTLPYLERVYKAYPSEKFAFLGVSQNDKRDTQAFAKEYGISFPLAIDPSDKYPASNAYGLTNVPTFFFIAPDGSIELTSVGWVKADIEELNRRLAKLAGVKPKPVFKPGEDVPEFKAG